jgi:hypothetical protein
VRIGENFRHPTLDDVSRQSLGNRCLADTCLTNQQWVVLAPPAQRLNDALEFLVAADQGVDLAGQCLLRSGSG